MENLAVEMIPDIDSCDSKDPLAAVDYVEEIYSFYRQIEVGLAVSGVAISTFLGLIAFYAF